MACDDEGLSASGRLSEVASLLAWGILRVSLPKVTGLDQEEAEKPRNSSVQPQDGLAVSSSSSPDASVGSRA